MLSDHPSPVRPGYIVLHSKLLKVVSPLGWERSGGTAQRRAALLAAECLLVVSVLSFAVCFLQEQPKTSLAAPGLFSSNVNRVVFASCSHIHAMSILSQKEKVSKSGPKKPNCSSLVT